MFTKKFLESNFTPLNFITSRQRKLRPSEINGAPEGDMKQDVLPGTDNVTDPEPGLLSRHGGKLAVGAAAMLGIAAFYHWRESRLAKEDEEEYARLQRLKAALDAFESDSDH